MEQSLKNELLLKLLSGQKVERYPVWIMRQAGRTLKEYREVRSRVGSFKDLLKNPDLSSDVTVQPVDILGVDAAILFSDILVIPEALGINYSMFENVGPVFSSSVQKVEDISVEDNILHQRLQYVYASIPKTKQKLANRVPLIGFSGAPWTIFAYLMEGKGTKTFSKARKVLYTRPAFAHQCLEKITDAIILYLKKKIECGVDVVQLFDSWAGVLPSYHYEEFGLRYVEKICNSISNCPIIFYPKGAYSSMSKMNALSCDSIGVDWGIDMCEAREKLPNKIIQGNIDPCLLYADKSYIEKYIRKFVDSLKGDRRHIINLGHGLYPDTPRENIQHFVEIVKKIKI